MSKFTVLSIAAISILLLIFTNLFLAGNEHLGTVSDGIMLRYELQKQRNQNSRLQKNIESLNQENNKLRYEIKHVEHQLESLQQAPQIVPVVPVRRRIYREEPFTISAIQEVSDSTN